MGYADQKFYDRPQVLTVPSGNMTGTLTASGTNTLTPFQQNQFIRAKRVNSIWSVVQTAPAANLTSPLLYFTSVVGTTTGTFGTLTLGGTLGQVSKATISAATVTTNTFTNTLPNGSTVVTSNTTTTSYNQFAVGQAPTVTFIAVGTASGQNYGAYHIEQEEQELPS